MEQSTLQLEKKYNKNGYIQIFIDGYWILEHKYIVEQFIGRELKKNEVIPHINSIKSDNRISNLMIFKSQKEHKSFENKVKQFGFTNPVIRKINSRWNEYINNEE
jgi:hypothetical protein